MSYAFDTYRDETMALVKSIVLKLDIQNTLINEAFTQAGVTVIDDPTTWKYNLNLNGEYHANDAPITVISSDTRDEIVFDKATLASHPRTLADYNPKGQYYNALVKANPKQRVLIRSITRPIPMTDIVNAKDFQILDYDRDLIAKNETRLIPDLQEWIYEYVHRWWNPDAIITDPLYPACFVSILYSHMASAIMNIRLKYAKTIYASPFHIWNYLGSHYEIDQFQGYLTETQSLWLYRNIVDIRTKTGRRDKLEELILNLANPSGLDIDYLKFLQTYENLNDEGIPDSIYSFDDSVTEETEYTSSSLFNTRAIHELIKDKALDNESFLENDITEAQKKADRVRFDKLPTKILRARENGKIASQTIEKTGIKLNYWIYLAVNDIYNPRITIEMRDGRSKSFFSKDLIILFVYALNKTSGIDLHEIPELTLNSMVPLVYPTRDQLVRLINYDYVTDEDVDFLLDDPIDLYSVVDFESFEVLAEKVAERRIQHELYWERKPTPIKQSVMKDLTFSTWARAKCQLTDPSITFESWLEDQRIDDVLYSPTDWRELAEEILIKAIGYEEIQGELGSRQSAIVELIDRLTSYNIMLIKEGGNKRDKRLEIPNMMFYGVGASTYCIYDIFTGSYVLDQNRKVAWRNTADITVGNEVYIDDAKHDRFVIEEGVKITNHSTDPLKVKVIGADQHIFLNE